MTEEKKYVVKTAGDGHSPHMLAGADGEGELSLCSCGGTKNADGTCDGAHMKKKGLECSCWFCKEKEERMSGDFDSSVKCC